MIKTAFTVAPEQDRQRLDALIAAVSGLTRSSAQKLLSRNLVSVNSRFQKAGYRVRIGDRIELTVPDEPEGVLVPEEIPLDILWEDDHLVVVNKPPRMVVYPAAGNRRGTLMNALAATGRKLASAGAPLRPGIVHRLDKDTSGVLVIAKTDRTYYRLVDQFKEREVEKHYLALLYGCLKEDRGEIKALIGRSPSDRKKMSTRTRRGKEAVTRFEALEKFEGATLARVRIITGRTHQIRVHFASRGHPVLGDRTYGKKLVMKRRAGSISFPRQMLHAWRLKLKHPETGEALEFFAPLPADMEAAIRDLRGNLRS